jgi:hypothetical protein
VPGSFSSWGEACRLVPGGVVAMAVVCPFLGSVS